MGDGGELLARPSPLEFAPFAGRKLSGPMVRLDHRPFLARITDSPLRATVQEGSLLNYYTVFNSSMSKKKSTN